MSARWLRRAQGGSSGRLLALFVAVVVLVAIVGPGIAVYGADGQAPEGSTAPAEGALGVEAPAVGAPVVEAPVVETAPEAPVVEQPEAQAAAVVEAPVVLETPSIEAQATVAPAVLPAGGGSDGNPDLTAGGVRIPEPGAGETTWNSGNVEKIEPVVPADFWIRITAWEDPVDGWYFNFESNYAISRIIAKGGSTGYQEWTYDPAVKSGSNLHCPANSNNKYAAISHLDFYFDDQPDLAVYKFQDDDEDKAWDSESESMLENWEFKLYNADTDALLGTKYTNANGKICWADLEPGDYYVTETLIDGWDNTTALTQYVTLAAFGNCELWFGNVPEQESKPGDLTVYKFQDDDRDLAWDEEDEDMLAGWEFELYRGNYWDDVDDVLVDTGTTNADGKICWTDLEPGEYYAIETLQSGWDNTTSLVQHVTVVSNEERELWFGNVPEENEREFGDVIIHKFQDDDEDQVWDEGEEALLEDWEFTITGATTPPIVSTAAVWQLVDYTDAEGMILVENQPEGAVISATETLPEGWRNTTPVSQSIEVEGNETVELWFGNVPEEPKVGSVIIHKFSDDDEDQAWDQGAEDLLEDWEFTIGGVPPLQKGETGAWLVEKKTDALGEIKFENLPVGTVITATEKLQPGWENTTPLTQQITVQADKTVHLWFGNIEFLRFTELDLAITKTVDDRTVDEGQLLTYTLTYWNTMDDEAAYDYNIVDDYDERYLTIVDSAGGVVKDGKITWNFAGPLAKADGKKTITYTARVNADMPDKTTNIDNVVRIWDDKDKDPTNNQDDERVVYTPDDPYLPFSGGEYLLLVMVALFTGVAGLTLRLKPRKA